jgi:hypothetical protein
MADLFGFPKNLRNQALIKAVIREQMTDVNERHFFGAICQE